MLGGDEVCFLGQFRGDMEGLIVVVLDKAKREDLPKSIHSLPPPFHGKKIMGDIVMLKVDEDGEYVDVDIQEWRQYDEKWKRGELEEWEVDEKEGEEEEEDEQGDDDESSDDEDGQEYGESDSEDEAIDQSSLLDQLMPHLKEKFAKENGRQPTEEEIENIKAVVEGKFGEAIPN